MNRDDVIEAVIKLSACKDGLSWLRKQDPSCTEQQLWDLCPSWEYLLWVVENCDEVGHEFNTVQDIIDYAPCEATDQEIVDKIREKFPHPPKFPAWMNC